MPRAPRANSESGTQAGITPDVDAVDTAPGAVDEQFTVEDPEVLRPRTLPLVIKPKAGKWVNAEQEEYARVLNGYAYKNPEKWAKKKDVLLKQLADLAEHPEQIVTYRGADTNLTYNDKVYGANVLPR